MNDEQFTPNLGNLRAAYQAYVGMERNTAPEFDRWLAEHDGQVRASTARAIAQRIERIGTYDRSPASHWIKWMRHLADSGSTLLEPVSTGNVTSKDADA